ncbi:unnamed protein product [Prunus brigantina]
MGCCLGTAKTPNQHPHHHPNGPNNRHFHARSSVTEPDPTHIQKTQLRASTPPPPPPPPPVVEEESVKEVLSETPISKPQIPKISQDQNTQLPPKFQEELPDFPPQPQAEPIHFPPNPQAELTHFPPNLQAELTHVPPKLQAEQPKELSEEPSQASDLCGVSESFSLSTTTTTTTITDAREDEATSKRKRDAGHRDRASGPSSTTARCKRPYSGELAGRREKGVKLPARAPESPMGKRNRTETRSSRGRESGQLRTMQRGAGPTGVRRDAVSSRSRSPATRTAGGAGRAAVGRSPAKVTGRAAAGGSSSQQGAVESEGKQIKKEAEPSNDGVSQPQKQGNESLELECFIFV